MLAVVLIVGHHHCLPSAACNIYPSSLNSGSSPLPALCFLYYIHLLHCLLHLQHHLLTKHLAESLETSVVLVEQRTFFPSLMRVVLWTSHLNLLPESLWAKTRDLNPLNLTLSSRGQGAKPLWKAYCKWSAVWLSPKHEPGTRHTAMSHAGGFAWPQQVII